MWQDRPFKIEAKAGQTVALCMCGLSSNPPYCDGSHKGTDIKPRLERHEEDRILWVCGCLESGNRPFCDGTHKNLEVSQKVWVKVGESRDFPDEEPTAVTAEGRALVVTYRGGSYGVIDGHCPHQGGPLAEGSLDEGGCLRCPWHGWAFDPLTGVGEQGTVATYPSELREDGLYVEVPKAPETRTVSDVMVETMVNWGVTHVFGMVGHSNLGLADAIRKQEEKGNLQFIGIRHEGAAAFACSGFAKASGRPAACLTIAGPGATNLLTGLWDAKVDRAPVLALTGQVQTQVLGPGAFQEIDLSSAFASVSAFSQTVLSESRHAELMNLALKTAIVERDVAHLIFPDEVQVLESSGEASNSEGRLSEVQISPPPESVSKTLELLGKSERPAIIVGYGAREAMPSIIRLAERLKAPFAYHL